MFNATTFCVLNESKLHFLKLYTGNKTVTIMPALHKHRSVFCIDFYSVFLHKKKRLVLALVNESSCKLMQ